MYINGHQSTEMDNKADSEDAYNLVSQTRWEKDVIWDPDVVRQEVLKNAPKKCATSGWLPMGPTYSAPEFVKQIDCPFDNQMKYERHKINNNCVNNSCNKTPKNCDNNQNKDNNNKSSSNRLSKNLRKRKATEEIVTASDETQAICVPKKIWITTLKEENPLLVYHLWEDKIIWDNEDMDISSEPEIMFNEDDDNYIIPSIDDMNDNSNDSQAVGFISLSSDQLNISNDQFYASVEKANSSSTHNLIISHSIPAIKLDSLLFPTFLLDLQRPLLKRSRALPSKVEHNVYFCNKRIKLNGCIVNDDIEDRATDLSKYTINAITDLTACNGEVVLMEYSEEEPPFFMRVGMGSQIINYFQKDKNSCPPTHRFAQTKTVTSSPFIGEIGAGKSQLSLETNMFRSPIFEHTFPETDFLVIRTFDKYFIRDISGLFVVGQQLPLIEVPRPKSKQYYDFIRQFAKMFIYRYFNGRKTVSGLDTELQKAFPNISNHFRTKILRDYTIRQYERFALKSEIPFDIQINNLLTPEDCCSYYSTSFAINKFKQMGFGDRLYLNNEIKDDNKLDELSIAPWNTTASYIATLNAKKWLNISNYNEDGSLLFVNQSYRDFKDQMPTIKKCQPLTNLSIKRVSLQRAHEWLINYGLSKDRVKKLKNVIECQFIIKELSEKLRQNGVRAGVTKSQTTEQHYRLECQKVFDLHSTYYSNNEMFESDEEEEEEESECDSELEDMGKDLEAMILENKTLEQIEHEREEEERKSFMKALKEGKSVKDIKNDETRESLKGKLLKITRLYEINGKREIRTEVVRRREVIEAYVRIRKTKTSEFIKQLSFVGNHSENGNILSKHKSKSKQPLNIVNNNNNNISKPINGSIKSKPKSESQASDAKLNHNQNDVKLYDYNNIDINEDNDWDISDTSFDVQQPLVSVEGNKIKFSKAVVIEANEMAEEERRRIEEEEEEERQSKTVNYFQVRSKTRCRIDPMVKLKEVFDKLIVDARRCEDLEDCVDFFNEPVKVKEVPDYYDIIKDPMDLTKIRLKVSENKYWTRKAFLKDIQLIYENSVEYNGADNDITLNAAKLVEFCKERLNSLSDELEKYEKLLETDDHYHLKQYMVFIIANDDNSVADIQTTTNG
ncbi:transcription initiation factor TFIID subunit 1-like [Oppia nitens]|uniref:transcription initiation factor TFIID subunit 1-like n=1 Tax=Oppia nitens TaxID=1686743 RepID=UPI0023DA01D8|nr:transcription initiation factor TFIID subunit 1-like [Oppia nitens]